MTPNERKMQDAHRMTAVACGRLSIMIARRKLNKGALTTMASEMRKVADLLESVD